MTLVFLLDFDETLSPSNWLNDNGYIMTRPTGKNLETIKTLGKTVYRFLDYTSDIGVVEIVTTAYSVWVAFVLTCYSTDECKFVVSETHEAFHINGKRIGITSCRRLYKIHANPKEDITHKFIRRHGAKVVIGRGDGDDEKDAIISNL